MIRHLFKMIWNKKKQNSLLIVEMLVSFMVVFAVFTLVVYNYQNYVRGMGFDYENVLVINYTSEDSKESIDTIMMKSLSVRNQILSMPEVTAAAYSSNNVPFSMSRNNGTLTHNKDDVDGVNRYTADDSYGKVLNVKLTEGRWFSKQDVASKDRAVVINQSLKERLFKNNSPIGQLLGDPSDEPRKRVVGVIEDMKLNGDFQSQEYGVYERADTGAYRWLNRVLVKVKPGAGADFEAKLFKMMGGNIANSNIEIEHLTEKLRTRNNLSLVPMIILLIVAGFLIINVALGLFGVLWYNISRRRGEIGLRRAVGASSTAISKQLVGETIVLATLSLIVGSFFAVQFPLLKLFDLPAIVYGIAWLCSIAFIYLLVMICAFYPGKQAAAIHPAIALHEE